MQWVLQRPQKLIPFVEHSRVIAIGPRVIWETHCVTFQHYTGTPQAKHTTWHGSVHHPLASTLVYLRLWATSINEKVGREVWNCAHLKRYWCLSTRHHFPVGDTSCSKLLWSVSYSTKQASASMTSLSDLLTERFKFLLRIREVSGPYLDTETG
jgi:hypothetical protein